MRFVGKISELMRILKLAAEVENERRKLQKEVKKCPAE